MSVEWFELPDGKRAIVFDPDEIDITGALSILGVSGRRLRERLTTVIDDGEEIRVRANGVDIGVASGITCEFDYPHLTGNGGGFDLFLDDGPRKRYSINFDNLTISSNAFPFKIGW